MVRRGSEQDDLKKQHLSQDPKNAGDSANFQTGRNQRGGSLPGARKDRQGRVVGEQAARQNDIRLLRK